MKGPLLIAANHPNSFLDAIIVDTLFKHPVTSLTRGDVFKVKIFSKILHSLHMLPIYRVSEGAENLEQNYATFDRCNTIFREGGIVLIFSEGGCTNEWHLRKLKKGTARLAISAWNQGIPLKVLPLGINYSSFRKFGKNIWMNFGNIITRDNIEEDFEMGKSFISFNNQLTSELRDLVYEIEQKDTTTIKKHFYSSLPVWKKIILSPFAFAGYIFHVPLYRAMKAMVRKRENDHYDSILVGLLFFSYPVYLGIIIAITLLAFGWVYSVFLLMIIPFSAWALLQVKKD